MIADIVIPDFWLGVFFGALLMLSFVIFAALTWGKK